MNSLYLRARQAAAFVHAEERAQGAANTMAVRMAAPPTAQAPKGNRMDTFLRTSNSEVGFEARELPFAEIARVMALPVITPMDAHELEAYQKDNILAEAYNDGFRFFPAQANSLMAFEMYDSLFANVGVGFGKTLIGLGVANRGYAQGLKRELLIVPPNVVRQLMMTDIKFARNHIPFNVPVHSLAGRDAAYRKALAKSKKKGLYITTYSLLSTKDAQEVLDAIQPELIILDEAHNVSSAASARTRRLFNYIEEHKPRVVAMSGTLTKKSVRDYAKLIKACLRDNCPLPHSAALVNEWAEVIDAQPLGTYGHAQEVRRGDSPLMPLIQWAKQTFKECVQCEGKGELFDEDTGEVTVCPSCEGTRQEKFTSDVAGFRKAFKYRLTTTPGVVSTGDASIGVSLVIENRPVEKPELVEGWDTLQRHIDAINDEWTTPNGDEIQHAIHCWKWLYELSCGFYNKLSWPSEEVYAKRKHIDVTEAYDILARAKEYHEAHQIYAKRLRKWIDDHGFARCDTPVLVGAEMARNGGENVSPELFEAWEYSRSKDFLGRPDRDRIAVRVCPHKINAAVAWAAEQVNDDKGGIMWVYHQEVGQWLYESLTAAGIEATYCPAGDQHNKTICRLGDISQGGTGKDIVVASHTAHGTGKNLQAFSQNYIMQWPRPAVQAEQLLGRTHRNGQPEDEVRVVTNITDEFDQLNMAACLNDALYIRQTLGNRQKLIYASYDPLPKIFPTAVLAQRGLEPRILSREQERLMREKFGG